MILNDKQINEAVSKGEIKIGDFSEDCIQPASYDMRIGPLGYVSTNKEIINIKDKGLLILRRGDFGVVETLESIELPLNYVARFGIRSQFSRKGLFAATGPQIDPGYKGRLFISLINLSPTDIALTYKQKFCTIEIHKLSEPVSKAYDGPYQGQFELTYKEIDPLIQQGQMPFSEIFTILETLGRDVGKLSDRINNLLIFLPIILIMGFIILSLIVMLK